MNYAETIKNPAPWFEFSRKQQRVANMLFQGIFDKDYLINLRNSQDFDDYIGVFSNVHFHWGIAIENGFKAMLIKYRPELIQYEVDGKNVKITRMAGRSHNLLELAELSGMLGKEYGLYKHESDYVVLKEVLKHLTEMVKWGAKYPMPMNSAAVKQFSGKIPSRIVYGFHVLDVVDPLFKAFEREASV